MVTTHIAGGAATGEVGTGAVATRGGAAEDQDLRGVVWVEWPHGTACHTLTFKLVLTEQHFTALINCTAVKEVAIVVQNLCASRDGQHSSQHTPVKDYYNIYGGIIGSNFPVPI